MSSENLWGYHSLIYESLNLRYIFITCYQIMNFMTNLWTFEYSYQAIFSTLRNNRSFNYFRWSFCVLFPGWDLSAPHLTHTGCTPTVDTDILCLGLCPHILGRLQRDRLHQYLVCFRDICSVACGRTERPDSMLSQWNATQAGAVEKLNSVQL